jgi:hypothetical protein
MRMQEKVIGMQSDSRTVAPLPHRLLNPPYWLVSTLEWVDDGEVSEAAVAIAPSIIPREPVSCDARQVLGCADLYCRKHRERVVFFSDLTRMFTDAGTSWSQLGVDWESALRELHGGQFPALFMTTSERAYVVIADAAAATTSASAEIVRNVEDERELVRRSIARQLGSNWPPYIRTTAESGRLSFASR